MSHSKLLPTCIQSILGAMLALLIALSATSAQARLINIKVGDSRRQARKILARYKSHQPQGSAGDGYHHDIIKFFFFRWIEKTH